MIILSSQQGGRGHEEGPQLHLIVLIWTIIIQSPKEDGVGFLIVPVLQMRPSRLREAVGLLKVSQQ